MNYSFNGPILVDRVFFNLKLNNIPYGFDKTKKFYRLKFENNKYNDKPIIIICCGMNKPIACYLVDKNKNLEQCSFCSGKKNKICEKHINCFQSNNYDEDELFFILRDKKYYE